MKFAELIFLKKFMESSREEISDFYISDFSADKNEIILGDSITLNTSVKAPEGSNLTYKYIIQFKNVWSTIRPANTVSTFIWTPIEVGIYAIRVIVSDGINELRQDITVTVIENQKTNSQDSTE